MPAGFAATPEPPYCAVIFTSQRTESDDGYAAMADAMLELATEQPGFLGAESARGADGLGITVAYFEDEAAIHAWKRNARHLAAQSKGKARTGIPITKSGSQRLNGGIQVRKGADAESGRLLHRLLASSRARLAACNAAAQTRDRKGLRHP